MNTNYGAMPGPGDLPGDSTNPNSPDYVERESILDCPNETGTWLADNMAAEVQERAIEIIGDFLASSQDVYAVRKMQRLFSEFAYRCEDRIRKFEEAL